MKSAPSSSFADPVSGSDLPGHDASNTGIEISDATVSDDQFRTVSWEWISAYFSKREGCLNRIVSHGFLMLEGAEPRTWHQSWQDSESFDSFNQFVSSGQLPTR